MSNLSKFNVVIPARYASVRLPGKPLLKIKGKPIIQYVYENAVASGAQEVIIATDDERIASECRAFDAKVVLTAISHSSGTERIAEVSEREKWQTDTIVVNLQGDEPLVPANLVGQVAHDIASHTEASITTLATPIHEVDDLFDPNVVKVVLDRAGFALYFSRAAVPWDRDTFAQSKRILPIRSTYFRHIGLYAYRVGYLSQYTHKKASTLEQSECLEQLRALWYGAKIHVGIVDKPPGHGVDTLEDLNRVEQLL